MNLLHSKVINVYSGKELGGERMGPLYQALSSCVGSEHSCPSGWAVACARRHQGGSVHLLVRVGRKRSRDGEIWVTAGGNMEHNVCSLFQIMQVSLLSGIWHFFHVSKLFTLIN